MQKVTSLFRIDNVNVNYNSFDYTKLAALALIPAIFALSITATLPSLSMIFPSRYRCVERQHLALSRQTLDLPAA
ncbi:hypothetical protein CcaCcLH18_12368 [Colletotrichum camelliae]|nr:hypothetical protein CcaCcLH18_12368 [Colletotrichum camelliae]